MIHSNPKQTLAASAPVSVRFVRVGDMLVAQFKVTTRTIAAKSQLRQEYYVGVQHRFTHSANIVQGGWEADMRITLACLGWDGKQPLELVGNAYAALGEDDGRVYWSLFELPTGPADYHVPGAFRPLFKTQ